MNQIVALWTGLEPRKRIISVVSAIAVFGAVLLMAQVASQPRMSLLYAQMQDGAAGDVVRVLEQMGVAYEVRGGSIFVPATQRDELRLSLASEGLPANGPKGYELLDSLSGFGTTAQMFDAAYWRAKEGELARTILSSSGVSGARVHIGYGENSPFQRDQGITASVFLTSATGTIDADLARAMRFLVASAVPRLDPTDVSIIDSTGRLVSSDVEDTPIAHGEDRANQLRERVQRLVEARVGFGNAVVEVSVDTATESESILERRFDPAGRVAISTDTEERTSQSNDGGAGVTVASNLPDGDAAGGAGTSSQNNETRERVNYEVSETTREITRAAGAVRRLTVAVLVNGTKSVDENGVESFVPLPEPEIDALRALVESAVGFDDTRGDQITIRSMAFEERLASGTSAVSPPWYHGQFDLMTLAQLAILGFVALLIGMFVLRPILASGSAQPVGLPAPDDTSSLAELPDIEAEGFDAGPLDGDGAEELPVLVSADGFDSEFGFAAEGQEDPIDRLRGLIDSRREETVEVLRSWLDEKEQA